MVQDDVIFLWSDFCLLNVEITLNQFQGLRLFSWVTGTPGDRVLSMEESFYFYFTPSFLSTSSLLLSFQVLSKM